MTPYIITSLIYLLTGAIVLGKLARWQSIELLTERTKYAWSWHWRYLGCLLIWPLISLFVFLENATIQMNDKK